MTVEAGAAVDGSAVSRFATSADLVRHVVHDRRVAFLLAGGLNTAFGFSCFVAYQTLLGHVASYMLVLLLAHATSLFFAFTVHRRFVFRVTGNLWQDLWRFESVNLTSLGVNAVLLPLCVEGMGLPVIASQGFVTAVIAVISWLGHSRFSFSRKAAGV